MHLFSGFKPNCQECNGERTVSLVDGAGTTGYHLKRIKLDPVSHLYRSQLQMVYSISIRGESVTLLEDLRKATL